MTGPEFLQICAQIALIVLAGSLVLVLVRLYKGPTLADRILALDVLVSLGIGLIATIAIKTGFYLYLDIAITLGLVGFLATVAFARFLLYRKPTENPAADLASSENQKSEEKV